VGIKAIETRYAGCRFRSRLEARWAVLFDTLGIEWQYEPEGFDLPGGRYLPDFRFPGGGWLEVKGPPPSDQELKKVCELAQHTGQNVALVWGDIPRTIEDGNAIGVAPSWLGPATVPAVLLLAHMNHYRFSHGLRLLSPEAASEYLQPALNAARSARFEFGEKG
jgi:hypothetical protein